MTIPQIQQLDSHVADLISAGEVVERPASVVKELVENALDAGATAVAVEIQNGGMRLIRVTDNGCGIAAGELPTAFLRHATSKLRCAGDLGKIGTLGFRGEALAAISAVSRVEISTCRAGETGSVLHLEGGVPGTVESAGVPVGTTIIVRDLFFNTPARLKFMKKDSTETGAISSLLQHLALSRPEVSFKFIKDGAEALHTPGDGKLESAVYAALGREFAKGLTPVQGSGNGVAVSGFVTKPLCGRGSRGMQIFFVNGRFIKSQLLTAAVEEGYRNQIMKGKFPGCVVRVELPVTEVDVNVHPAKTNVKFARERDVFDAVYHTVLDCLAADGQPVPPPPKAEAVVNPRQDFYQTMDAKAFRQRAEAAGKPAHAAPPSWQTAGKPAVGWNTERKAETLRVADSAPQKPFVYEPSPAAPIEPFGGRGGLNAAVSKPDAFPKAPGAAPPLAEAKGLERNPDPVKQFEAAHRPTGMGGERGSGTPAIPPEQAALPLPGERMSDEGRVAPWRIAGEVLKTYIVCEDERQNVWLIDKHAAHERINFDRLKAAAQPPMRQTLLRPAAVELEREAREVLLEHVALLESLGFACEDFGDGAVLLREVPADLDAADAANTLEELAENLRTGRNPDEKRESLLHTIACKAAIKAGWDSDESELRVLVDKVQSGEIQYCPHGRPVKVKLSKYELEKMFKRA